jgi:hypothetical protein
LHSQVTVPQTHTSKESSRRALTRGIGGGGVVKRFGGVLGDLPRGPKTSILAIGGSLKNSQDDAMSAFFFADFA